MWILFGRNFLALLLLTVCVSVPAFSRPIVQVVTSSGVVEVVNLGTGRWGVPPGFVGTQSNPIPVQNADAVTLRIGDTFNPQFAPGSSGVNGLNPQTTFHSSGSLLGNLDVICFGCNGPSPSVTILNWQSLPLNVARVMVARVSLGVDASAPNPPYNDTNSMLVEVWFVRAGSPPIPVSWWPADGNTQDVQDDNDGTLKNGAGFAPGLADQAFSLDGSDDFVLVANAPNLNPSSITVGAWINPDNVDGFRRIVSKGQALIDLFIGPDRRLRCILNPQSLQFSCCGVDVPTSGVRVRSRVWSHVACSYDSTSGQGKVYLNGERVGGVLDLSDDNPLRATPGDFFIGRHWRSGSSYFDGRIDEVKVFDRALSATEIRGIFEGGAGAFRPAIGSISPNRAPPGTEIAITGTGFSVRDIEVFFDGVPGLNVAVVDDTRIVVTVPDLSPGPVVITVKTAGGMATSGFTVEAPPLPVITSVFPSSASPGSQIRISGTGFVGDVQVTFNGEAGIGVQVGRKGSIVFFQCGGPCILVTVPGLPSGPVDITVSTTGGRATLPGGAGGFTVVERVGGPIVKVVTENGRVEVVPVGFGRWGLPADIPGSRSNPIPVQNADAVTLRIGDTFNPQFAPGSPGINGLNPQTTFHTNQTLIGQLDVLCFGCNGPKPSITILNWQSLPLNVARVMVARVSLGVDATLPNPPYNNANSMLVEVWFTRTINRPPTVSAGSNQTVQFGHTVTLRGTVFDPDGDSTTVLWTLIGGTGSNGIQINGANSGHPVNGEVGTWLAPSGSQICSPFACPYSRLQ